MEISISAVNDRRLRLLLLFLMICLHGCASMGIGDGPVAGPPLVQMAGESDLGEFPSPPVFLIENGSIGYNLIGRPVAKLDQEGNEIIMVDPFQGVIYQDRKTFVTEKGVYTNLIYRVHFEKVPWSLDEIHLTAGSNPGLLIIYTLDTSGRPLLLTTVHTCGCFLAFIPTDLMPQQSLPDNWPSKTQKIYGQTLPATIATPCFAQNQRFLIRLEHATHRVAGVEIVDATGLEQQYQSEKLELRDMDTLWRLPLGDQHTSFFEQDGCRKGYVKNNSKPLEMLLLGWLALDLKVGEDKFYGFPEQSDTVFYTSLKFWRRNESDMENFPRFLEYWGWKL